MKKIFMLTCAVMVSLALSFQAYCAEQAINTGKKSLIIYYSLSGNTKTVVNILQELVGAEAMEIKPVRPYPDDFHAVVEQAREERRTNFLPPIQALTHDPQAYDIIYLGFPIWGNTIPQPMAAFLSQNNLAGKTIIPFCTHDGYGVGMAFDTVQSYCPQAKLLTGFDMLGADARNAKTLLETWLKSIHVDLAQKNAASAANEIPLVITVGDKTINGVLYDNATAQEFKKLLPLTVSMAEYGGREFYGSIEERISTQAEGQLFFADGDITYCPQNNSVAIFFAQTERPNLTMRVIPVGKVTSDLSIFQETEKHADISFVLQK